jgi:hypothetical protein
MTRRYSLPPLRDLPADRLTQRKQHLLSEIRRVKPARQRFSLAWPQRRRLVLALTTAVVLGAFIAAPALGLQNAIRDLLGRSDVRFGDAPPAASVIKRDFADMASGAPVGMNPRVIEGQTKLAATFGFGGTKRRVWVAPTETAGFCYVFEGISGGCLTPQAASDGLALDGGFVVRPGASAPAMDKLVGEVFEPRATVLQVTFEDQTTIKVPFVYVSDPISAGFFAYKPTAAQQQPGHRPSSIALLDGAGATLASERIDWANEDRKFKEMRLGFENDASSSPSRAPAGG